MPHYCLIGENEFMRSKILDNLQEAAGVGNIVYKSHVNDVYFLVRNSSSNLLIVCDGHHTVLEYNVLKEVDIKEHHLVWIIANRSQAKILPFKVDNTFLCSDFTDEKFLTFVQGVLKDNGVNLNEENLLYLTNRLDKKDLYWSYSELLKLAGHIKHIDKVTQREIRWVGNPKKKTPLDLFDAFLKKRGVLKVLLNLEYQEIVPLQISAFFLETVEKIIHLKIYKKRGDVKDLSQILHIHPYFLSKLDNLSTNLSINDFIRWHKRLCEIDIGLKYSGVEGYILLKVFFLEES